MQGGWGLFRGGVLNSTKIDRFMRAFYSDQFVLPLPAGHRFPMPKYRRLRDRLALEVPEVDMQVAAPATDGELALVHSPSYIQAVVQGTLSDKAQREIGFPWSPAMVERSRRSAGATVMAARAALFQGEGVSANLAGADPHEGDRLGRLKLSFDGLEARDRRVFDWCFAKRVPVAFAMAGGYGVDIENTVQVQVNTYRVAQAYWRRWQNLAQ